MPSKSKFAEQLPEQIWSLWFRKQLSLNMYYPLSGAFTLISRLPLPLITLRHGLSPRQATAEHCAVRNQFTTLAAQPTEHVHRRDSNCTRNYCGSTHASMSGNGSIMRLGPVPMLLHAHPELAIQVSGESSRTTHASRACVDSCRYFAGLVRLSTIN